LFVTKRNSYFTVSGDNPSNFVLLQPSKYIGCCAHRTIANDDMGNVIFLSDRGVFISDGGKPAYISKNIESIFTNADGAPWTVNRNVLTASHAVYDAFFRRYWLWIASSDSSVPNKVLIADFNLAGEDNQPEWFVADITANCSGIVKDDTGLPFINFGTTGGYIYKIDASATNDGAGTNAAETRRGTCTASGNSTLTDGLATFNTTDDGLAGCKIYIVSGTNSGEYKIISSNTTTVITITDTWTTNPDTTSVYAIGAINAYWKSKVFTWENFKLKIINWMKIVFKTQSSSYNLSVNRYEEESSTISETQAVSMSDNYSKKFFAPNKAKRHQIEFKIYDADRPFMITDVELNVDERNDR
jgi:hypothetical protein